MSRIIPDNIIGLVDQAYSVADHALSQVIDGFRRDIAAGATPEELFYGITRAAVEELIKAAGNNPLPPAVLAMAEKLAQSLAVGHIRLARLPEQPAAVAPPRVILDPGQEHRVAMMLPTGRIVDVVVTCETRGDRQQLVATIGAGDVGHVAIRTPETGKWSPL